MVASGLPMTSNSGWIGSTTPFGAVVRKPWLRCSSNC
jgi:hypothetical protein